jgi:hypothetical protein
MTVAACVDGPAALTRQIEARRLASDLQVSFLRAVEAANRAVMAETDDASEAAASESKAATEQAGDALQRLEPVLASLGYRSEIETLTAFKGRFDELRALDAEILPLAVENTNLKAQRLSFGPVRQASDRLSSSLKAAAASARSPGVEAQVAAMRAAVLEIQVLQARHIAEPKDAVMDDIEASMAALFSEAQSDLQHLRRLLPAARSDLTAADLALDQLMTLNQELVALSRRNTNVRSLALSLGRKRLVIAACEDQLAALNEALAKHDVPATR